MLKSLLLKLLNWWVGYKQITPPPPIIFDEVDIPPLPVLPIDYERPSPKIRITRDNVSMRNEGDGTATATITGLPQGTYWTTVANTGSMESGIDDGMRVLLAPLVDESDLIVGDIIVYESWDGQFIMHRVVEIGQDAGGWFCYTRGDNPLITINDPWKVRVAQLQFLYRGVVL